MQDQRPSQSGDDWAQRYRWAKCREPQKTELDTLGSKWIEGTLSGEQLAVELWEMWGELRVDEFSMDGAHRRNVTDIRNQVEYLAEAMHIALHRPNTSREDRRDILNRVLKPGGHGGSGIHR